MDTKKLLGQFFTTNYKYILQNLYIPDNVSNIIEPFCGSGHLLDFIDETKYQIECYDVDISKFEKNKKITQRDTLLDPPDYTNKFILTNPPYLARNKTEFKEIFEKYKVNDLYKCFIKEIITNKCIGGIIILSLHFWCSIRTNDIALRKQFLSVYEVSLINIFEEQVFEDTTSTVCSFQFKLKPSSNTSPVPIHVHIYPSNINIETHLDESCNYLIGGFLYTVPVRHNYTISRLTSKNVDKKNTNILAKCIDINQNNKIGLSIVDDGHIYIDNTPNLTARTYATLVIEPSITLEQQHILVKKFNDFLNKNRNTYHSLFLSNYRESKDISRKRISFELVYHLVEYILDQ